MANYPHYNKSTAARNNWEPAYNAQFKVIITPPPAISAGWNLVMESVRRVGGLETHKMPEIVEQSFFGNNVRHAAGSIAGANTVDLSLDFNVNLNDENSAYVYKALRRWCDLIYDPLTGRFGLKKDFVGGPIVISAHNKNGDVYQEWKFPVVFPGQALPAREFDYNEGGIFEITDFTLLADVWDETIL